MDNEVELGEILRPAGLTAGKDLGCGKVFQVLMIRDHVNRSTGTFEEVLPDMESLKDCEQFFVMGVIIEFWGTEVWEWKATGWISPELVWMERMAPRA